MPTHEVDHHVAPPGRSLRFLSDEAVARHVADGDAAAFEVLFDRYRSPVYRFCRALMRSTDDAELAFRTAMLEAYRVLRSSPPERLLVRPWFYRAAREAGLAITADRRPMDDVLDRQAPADTRALLEMSPEVQRLLAELHTLSEPERAALLLYEMSGLPSESVAEAMSASRSDARRLVHQARQTLSASGLATGLGCAAVREMISATDKSALRGRHSASHLRTCGSCQGFLAEQERLRGRMAAFLPTVPALVTERILAQISRPLAPAAVPPGSEAPEEQDARAPHDPLAAEPPAPAPPPKLAVVGPAVDSAAQTIPDVRRLAVVGGVAGAVAASAGALAIIGGLGGPAEAPETDALPARSASTAQVVPAPADGLTPAPPNRDPGVPRPASILPATDAPAPRSAARPGPEPAQPAAPETADEDADRPSSSPGSGFQPGAPASRPVTRRPAAPPRDAPPAVPEPAPVIAPAPSVPTRVPAERTGGSDSGGGAARPPVAGVRDAEEPPDPTAGGTVAGTGSGTTPSDGGTGPLDTPARDGVPDAGSPEPDPEPEGSGLAGLPGLVIAALPTLGSRAGSALRDRDAGSVRQGESQGTGDLGIGGINIGRPPTVLGAAAGLRVPVRRPRTDTVLWTVPGALFDLIRDPVKGFVRGEPGAVPASRVAFLGWQLGGALPRPAEEGDGPPG